MRREVMSDQTQRKLIVPWGWLAVSAALALLGAVLFCPPLLPIWSVWLGLFVLFASGALTLVWSNRTITYPFALLTLFSMAYCLGPLYCYWYPDVLDSFGHTDRLDRKNVV